MAITFSVTTGMKPGDEDRRYRIKVLLAASQRPKYWSFHCVQCGNKVAELSGNILAINDTADVTAIVDWSPAPVLVRCPDKYCRFWYEFLTLS
jgi:hypothetical protein